MKEKEFNDIITERKKVMSVLAKPVEEMILIKESEAQKFIQDFNENKVSKEFLDSCKRASKLFEKRNQEVKK